MAVALSLYVINIHAVLCRLFRIKLRVRFISAICIDHLEAMLLSDFNHSFIFPYGLCRQPSAFWAFCGPYLLIGTSYPDLVDIYSYPFNLCKGVYPNLTPFQLNTT